MERGFSGRSNLIIARRLREFLAMSANVNFDAKLQTQEGRKTFVDKQYDKSPRTGRYVSAPDVKLRPLRGRRQPSG